MRLDLRYLGVEFGPIEIEVRPLVAQFCLRDLYLIPLGVHFRLITSVLVPSESILGTGSQFLATKRKCLGSWQFTFCL